MRPIRIALAALISVSSLSACGGGRHPAAGPPPASGIGAPAPASAVEQFIGLAGQQKYVEMGYVFGNVRGPIAERQAPQRVARRMEALATLLRNDGYSILGVVPVAARPEARAVTVQLRRGRRNTEVPFTVVQGPGGRWLVEVVDVQALAGGA